MKLFLALFVLSTLLSCTSKIERIPASITPDREEDLIQIYQLEQEIEKYTELLKRTPRAHTKTGSKEVLKIDRSEREKIEKKLAQLSLDLDDLKSRSEEVNKSFGSSIPEIIAMNFNKNDRKFRHTLALKDKNLYRVSKHKEMMSYPIALHNVEEYQLTLRQEIQPKSKGKERSPHLNASFTCEGPYKFKITFMTKKHKANEVTKFRWYQSESNGQRSKAVLTKESGDCILRFKDEKKHEFALKITQEEEVIAPELKKFINRFEYCELPNAKGMGKVEDFYLTTKFRSMTCPKEIKSIRTLENTVDGLNAKAKALLGQELPKEMIENQDPYYPLDFSKAPKLDGIFISYLVFRRDFYGTVLERLIRHHAQQGTFVKIMVSEVISLDKDKEMLHRLDTEFPNVMVRFYKFDGDKVQDIRELFSKLHRTLHIKMFLTYSESEEENNVAVLGGRNIHDGFVFKTKPDLSKYPELVQYGPKGDEAFARWTDFEIELKGQKVLETLIGHYNSVFEYDNKDYFFRSYTMNKSSEAKINKKFLTRNDNILFRHFTSIPYRDGMALENFMVQEFDSAQKSITISTPYFNLTKNLTAAIDRAIQRGVKIQVITRLDLEGDTADIILSDVNKKTVNRFVDNIKVFEYINPADILHSKIVLIDGKVTLIGSVNFNQRSFYHDIENTLIIYSKDFNKKINSVLDIYKKKSREVTTEQDTKLWKSIIISIFQRAL